MTFLRWLRLVLVLALVVACGLVLALVTGLGYAGGRNGWAPTVATFVVLALLGGPLAVTRQWPRARAAVTASLVGVGLAAAVAIALVAPPTPTRLHQELFDVARPGWRLVELRTDGNTACFDYCLEVTQAYRVHLDADSATDALQPYLDRHDCASTGPTTWRCEVSADFSVQIEVLASDHGWSDVHLAAHQ